MNKRILISAPYLQPFIDRFKPFFEQNSIDIIVPEVKERLEEEDLLKYVEDIDGIICGDDRFTEKVLDSALRLKVISKWGTGIDSINKPECEKRGIIVRNTPNAFTVPVSDTVLAYILNFTRNISFMTESMRKGVWEKINGRAMHECILGVVGVGNIGESVLRKARAFGMPLLANDIKKIPSDLVIELDIQEVSFEELLRKSDFISINCDLNESSYHLIDKIAFGRMKSSAVLINTARGPIVNEKDLEDALESEQIYGAALDVFEEEPLPLTSPLLKHPRVLTAPHNSNSSPYAWESVHTSTINNMMESLGLNSRL